VVKMDVVGRCGIYCGACPIYRGTRGDEEAKKFARNVWKTPPNRMTCDGCHNIGLVSHGVDCPCRKCMDAKGHEYCNMCPEYSTYICEIFESMNRYFVKKGENLRENLARVTSSGTDAWLAEQEAKWSCPSCSSPIFWEEKKCPKCGKPLK
jgi:hypothetical protein